MNATRRPAALACLLLTVLCLGQPSGAAGVKEVLRLPFDDQERIYADHHAHARRLTGAGGQGAPEWAAAGRLGGALQFDGKGDGVMVDGGPALRFGPGQSFTVELWAKPLGGDTRTTRSILARGGTGGGAYWMFRLATKGRLGVLAGTAPGRRDVEVLAPRSALGTWHHLALVWDAEEGMARFYCDGELVRELRGPDRSGRFSVTGPLVLGGAFRSDRPFDGLIDELVVTRGAKRRFDLTGTGRATDAHQPRRYAPAASVVEEPDPDLAASWDRIDRAGLAIVPAPKQFSITGRPVAISADWRMVVRSPGLSAGIAEINRRVEALGGKALGEADKDEGNCIVVGTFDHVSDLLPLIGDP